MDEFNNEQQELEEIITNMENVNEPQEDDVPLFQNVGFETPFVNNTQTAVKESVKLAAKTTASRDSEFTIIGKSTVIDSNLKCGGNIKINGQIRGTVTVSGSVEINGVVEGDIVANDVTLKPGSKVTGNVGCKTDLNAEAGSSIKGNVVAKNAYVSSSIEGNVETSSELKIASTGAIIGNIVTANISVQSGAVINGNMSIKR